MIIQDHDVIDCCKCILNIILNIFSYNFFITYLDNNDRIFKSISFSISLETYLY